MFIQRPISIVQKINSFFKKSGFRAVSSTFAMLLSAALLSVLFSCTETGSNDAGETKKQPGGQLPPKPGEQLPVEDQPSTVQPTSDKAMAAGGTLSFVQSGSYWEEVHVFTDTGEGMLTVSRAPIAGTVKWLVVAGGGGGGASGAPLYGGGAGAGGLVMNETQSLNVGIYTVVVGSGGQGGSIDSRGDSYPTTKDAVHSYNGKPSTISGAGITDVIAVGGGGGGWHFDGKPAPGGDGGSGGAGSAMRDGGERTPGQGNDGVSFGRNSEKGGGGGYMEAGKGNDDGGAGGAGLAQTAIPAAVNVAGIPSEFAVGGTGGSRAAGAANTGNGGGGGDNSNGGAGGSGIVIIRFLHTTAPQ